GDADVALAGADDARAVRAQQLHVGEVPLQLVEEPGLVVGRHALGDADDELHAALGRLDDRVAHTGSGDEDAARGRAGGLDGLGPGRVHRDALDVGAGLAGVGPRDDLRAVLPVEQPVEAALAAGEALVDDLGVLVDEDRHGSGP